jgi:hypothetical protein
MNQPTNGYKTEEGFSLRFEERPSSELHVQMPDAVIRSLETVAISRDMSVEALVRFYVGQGLRQDLARQFADQVIAKTERVLSRHLSSKTEVATILDEIRQEATVA